MDPITHALLGGSLATAIRFKRLGTSAWLIAAVGAMVPDLDIFFRNPDPITQMTLHRHFTHSLIFIPVGGLLVALAFMLFPRFRPMWRQVYLAATLGYATHGLLDAATSWGTLLFWPFSEQRVALDWINIVDPIFTAALLIGLIAGVRRKAPHIALAAVLFCLLYLTVGAIQQGRAMATQRALAASRGQSIDHGRAMPTLGNLLVWRSIYRSGDSMVADAVREGLGEGQVKPGQTTRVASAADLAVQDEKSLADFQRFQWFSDGFAAPTPTDPTLLGDMRYSTRTGTMEPIWGVRFQDDRVIWENSFGIGNRSKMAGDLWSELRGSGFSK
jgi:inner membrane protein